LALGLSQEALADAVKMDGSAFSLLESGKRQPSVFTVRRLAAFFKCSCDDLILGQGEGR
jgi:transcriptional regulator with XRE-family HTH domain